MRRIIALVATLFAFAGLSAQTFNVEAPQVVEMDETFRVIFSSNGSISDFSWDCGENFEIVWGPQRGSQSYSSIVNGQRTSSHTESYTYLLQAKSTGKFTIQGAFAKIDKEAATTKSITIEVVEGKQEDNSADNYQSQQRQSQGQQSQQSSVTSGGTDIYLKFSLSKTSVVKGEPIVATLKLYARADILGFEDIKFPTFNGFWSKEIESPQNIEFSRENVDGKIYNSAILRKYVLIPQQTGTLIIDPAEMTIQTRVSVQSSGPRSIFDDFFSSYQTILKKIATKETKITVNALPQGAPDCFGNGVGNFSMKVELEPESLKSNDAATLKITISGKGNISMLSTPVINFPPDFEVYDVKSNEDIASDGTSGTKIFEFPFIPRSHGSYTLDPVEYAYYNIADGKYVTLKSDTLNIEVEKGDETDNGGIVIGGMSRQSVKNLSSDVRYIAHNNPNLREQGRFFACSPVFFILLSVIIGLYFVLDFILKRSSIRRKDIVGTKNRRANKLARARLQQAAVYKDKNLSSAYYEELHKALLGYISDKLYIPVADLAKDTISERLKDYEVSQTIIDKYINLIDACEYARYAPDAENNAMENQFNNAIDVISDIESSMKINKNNKSSKTFTIVTLLLAISFSSQAQTPNEIWNLANEAYSNASYEEALNHYQMIEATGLVSSDLFYNIGNTYFKLNDNAHAILYFEKSLKYNPGNKDALHNLEIAKQFSMDKIDDIPDFILITWIKDIKYLLSADKWAVATIVFIILGIGCLLAFKHLNRANKLSFVFACIFGLFAIISFAFSASERQDILSIDSAIVIQPVSTVKSSPDDAGKTLFMLHEGTKVYILDNLGKWVQIELSDGRQGWINNEDIEEI